MFHTIDTFEAHQVSLPFDTMIAIFFTISFIFKLLLLYLRISQFIVHSQMSYFSMCLLQHLWKKPILTVLQGIESFPHQRQRWENEKIAANFAQSTFIIL